MTDDIQAPVLPPLTEDEKALLRRCYRIKKITDHEIVFPLTAPAIAKAAWLTMFWFLGLGALVFLLWMGRTVGGQRPSLAWVLIGIVPAFLCIWLAVRKRSRLVLQRGGRNIIVYLGDGSWTIHLPQGVSPADWDFPTASVPVRGRSDKVEQVQASEILGRFSGFSLSETSENSFLPLLENCGADVVGYDENSVSLANFGSLRSWVFLVGVLLYGSPLLVAMAIPFILDRLQMMAVVFGTVGSGIVGIFGGCLLGWDSRPASVATFRKGKRQVLFRHRGTVSIHDVHEGAVRVVGDGDAGEFVVVHGVFSCSPICGTANLLAGFLRKYLAPPRDKAPTPDS